MIESCRRQSWTSDSLQHDAESVALSIDNDLLSYDSKVQSDERHKQPQLSAQETTWVRRLRSGMIIILTMSAAVAGVLSYWYLRRTEINKFHEMFRDDASKLDQGMRSNILRVISAMDLLSTSTVTHAHGAGEQFPFTTIPHYANVASKLLSMSAGILVGTYMFVDGFDERVKWEEYIWSKRSDVNETLQIMETDPNFHGDIPWNIPMSESIYGTYEAIPYNESRLFAPQCQGYPLAADTVAFNWDWLSTMYTQSLLHCYTSSNVVLGDAYIDMDVDSPEDIEENQFFAAIFAGLVEQDDNPMEPVSDLIYPIIDRYDKIQINDASDLDNVTNTVVGVVSSTFYWRDVMKRILPNGKEGLIVVVEFNISEQSLQRSFTYQINGQIANYLGRGVLHDPTYQHLGIRQKLAFTKETLLQLQYTGVPVSEDFCTYYVTFYPSSEMEKQFTTSNPAIFAVVAVLIFVVTSTVFVVYDKQVEQRQKLVMSTANASSAVLSSLFPNNVLDKVMHQESSNKSGEVAVNSHGAGTYSIPAIFPYTDKERSRLSDNNQSMLLKERFAKPIADLYPNTTVFFADISGFTAWSSSRGPDHVFILLESLYSEFDKIAQRRKVFKVETIGDSYVAVAGIPAPMKQHVTVMIKFAHDVLQVMKSVVNELCTCLGPETANLQLRVGLNSGPTTAGVIRGEKARFQLFGDTVNTASRMESTGLPGRIQCSSKTAELVKQEGKGHWLEQRNDVVQVKGKGEMITYWVQIQSESTTTSSVLDGICDSTCSSVNISSTPSNIHFSIQIDWIFDLFQGLLLDVRTFHSMTNCINAQQCSSGEEIQNDSIVDPGDEITVGRKSVPLDEVVEVLDLPANPMPVLSQLEKQNDYAKNLDPTIADQLRLLLTSIAKLYQDNPFHNFEHACHVVMSTKNLLDRTRLPATDGNNPLQLNIDPAIRLAIIFGALIHDVDHPGISNSQLTKEQASIALMYGDRCIAEQNSFDIAWRLLMDTKFQDLRQFLFCNNQEHNRFRQVTLNVVMATDIFDKDLTSLRQSRWDQVFAHKCNNSADNIQYHNRIATICIEHLIQASDVIHTMQHWTIYQKWNRKLFEEMMLAHGHGRMQASPCSSWYEGELWFFDNYIIPLAKKLQVCNVFGANSDAFLDFAYDNRMEWESKGKSIVKEWFEDLNVSHEYCDI